MSGLKYRKYDGQMAKTCKKKKKKKKKEGICTQNNKHTTEHNT